MILRRIIPAFLLALIASVCIAWFWLLHTASGANFVLGRLTGLTDGALSFSESSGDFSSGLRVARLGFASEGVRVETTAVILAIDVDLMPRAVEVRQLRLSDVQVEISGTGDADTAGDAPDVGAVLEALRLPFDLVVENAEIENLRVSGLLADQDLVVDKAILGLAWRDSIRIDRLELASPMGVASATGVMQLARPHAIELDVTAELAPALTRYDETIDMQAGVEGVLDEFRLAATSARFSADLAAIVSGVLTGPEWEAELNATLAEFGLRPTRIALSGNGDLGSAQVSALELRGDDVQATGSTSLRWSDGFEIVASLDVRHANIAAVLAEWPDAHPVAGKLDLEYTASRLRLSDSTVAIKGTAANIAADGAIDFAAGTVSGELGWSRLQWPLAVAEPVVASREGRIDLAGTLDDWRVDGQVALSAVGVDDGSFTITGAGDRQAAAAEIRDGNVLGGRVRGDVRYSWTGENAFSGTLDVEDVQTTPVLPDWPAVLSGRIALDGQRLPLIVDAQLDNVRGTLFERPLAANGGVRFAQGSFAARDLRVDHGASRAHLNGDLYTGDGLQFDVQVEDLGDYVADAAGDIRANGSLLLSGKLPSLRLTADSGALRIAGVEAYDLTISDRDSRAGTWSAELVASELSIAGQTVSGIRLVADIAEDRQVVDARFDYAEVGVELGLSGALDDWQSPSAWQGDVTELDVAVPELLPINLQQPFSVAASRNSVNVGTFCLAEADNASLCGTAEWIANQLLDLDVTLGDIPVDIVNSFRDSGFGFDQSLDGAVAWRWKAGERPTGTANISITPGVIRSVDRPALTIPTGEGLIAFEITDGRLLSGELNLPMPGTGHATGTFRATDIVAGLDSPIEGRIDTRLNSIAVVSVLTPLIDEAAGELQVAIDISGTVERPELYGSIDLDRGTLQYQPLGLRLEELELQARLSGNRTIDIDGSFRAGEGSATFETTTDFKERSAAGIQVQLRGENLTLINVPDIRATANADLEIEYLDNHLQLDGTLSFPAARIIPDNLGAGTVSESDDVEIVAGELPEQAEEESSELRIDGELTVSLGPSVEIDLGLAQANVTGSTRFTWTGDPVPMANGRYDMSGDIQAFGQVLEISDGGVRFTNVPADQPYVRLRAEREIFGNSQVKRAGVLVDGELRAPVIEAYTIPRTTEERALTLLVTGSDFDYESGAGAIDFGTYIAPRLFVSYGVGIFDRDNVISARYDLKSGFGIKATSGQKESGVDIIYRIER